MTREEHLLVIAIEECNEVAQRLSKALRFGLTEVQPGQTLSNTQRIRYEFSDLCAVLEMIDAPTPSGGHIFPPSGSAMDAKREKVEKFLTYSRDCGTLEASHAAVRASGEPQKETPRYVMTTLEQCFDVLDGASAQCEKLLAENAALRKQLAASASPAPAITRRCEYCQTDYEAAPAQAIRSHACVGQMLHAIDSRASASPSDDGARPPQEPDDDLHTGDDERIDCVTSIRAALDQMRDGRDVGHDCTEVDDAIPGILEACDALDALLLATIKRERAAASDDGASPSLASAVAPRTAEEYSTPEGLCTACSTEPCAEHAPPSAPRTAEPQPDLSALIDAANKEVFALNTGKKWQMCIPAKPTDSDLTLHAASQLLSASPRTAPAPRMDYHVCCECGKPIEGHMAVVTDKGDRHATCEPRTAPAPNVPKHDCLRCEGTGVPLDNENDVCGCLKRDNDDMEPRTAPAPSAEPQGDVTMFAGLPEHHQPSNLPASMSHAWQQIKTAPKDGREVLCTWVHTLVDGREHWCGAMHVLSWFKDWHGAGQGAWVLDGDFNVHFEPDEVHQTPPTEYGDPTHWMPLPHPPLPAQDATNTGKL